MPRLLSKDMPEREFENRILALEKQVKSISRTFLNQLRIVGAASEPTTTLKDGELIIWHNTGSGARYIVHRKSSTNFKVQLT